MAGVSAEEQRPLLEAEAGAGVQEADGGVLTARQQLQRRVALAVNSSLAANVALFAAKLFAFLVSGSMAVLASLLDSLIDLASQGIIAFAEVEMVRKDSRFPAGKSRLETMAVLGCAALMTLGAVGVIQESSEQLYAGLARGQLPELAMSPLLYAILAVATVLKLGLWAYCASLKKHSGAALALAEDHINDVLSNLAAIATAAVAATWPALWYADPAGGIGISLVIIARWLAITRHQVHKIIGIEAPEEFLELVREVAEGHHSDCALGFLRAYHAGQRLVVDLELEAPPDMTIEQAAEIASELKAKLEALPEVESAAVFTVPQRVRTSKSQPTLLHTSVCKPLAADLLHPGIGMGWAEAEAAPGPAALPPAPPEEAAAAEALEAGEAAPAPAAAAMPPCPPSRLRRLSMGPVGPPSISEAEEHLHAGSLSVGSLPEPGYLSRMAWQRSLKDAPNRVIRSASLLASDSLAMRTAHESHPH